MPGPADVPIPAPVLRFLLGAGLGFVVLMSIAPGWFYPPMFRGAANLLFGSFGSHRVAKFEPANDPRVMWDTKISVGTNAGGTPAYGSSMGFNSVREGYTPAAVLVALVLATPLAWPQKRRALVFGLAWVHAFVAIRVAVAAAHGFSRLGYGDRHLLEVGALGSRLLDLADKILTGDLHLTYIAPVLIWLFVAVRPASSSFLSLKTSSDAASTRPLRPSGSRAR